MTSMAIANTNNMPPNTAVQQDDRAVYAATANDSDTADTHPCRAFVYGLLFSVPLWLLIACAVWAVVG